MSCDLCRVAHQLFGRGCTSRLVATSAPHRLARYFFSFILQVLFSSCPQPRRCPQAKGRRTPKQVSVPDTCPSHKVCPTTTKAQQRNCCNCISAQTNPRCQAYGQHLCSSTCVQTVSGLRLRNAARAKTAEATGCAGWPPFSLPPTARAPCEGQHVAPDKSPSSASSRNP